MHVTCPDLCQSQSRQLPPSATPVAHILDTRFDNRYVPSRTPLALSDEQKADSELRFSREAEAYSSHHNRHVVTQLTFLAKHCGWAQATHYNQTIYHVEYLISGCSIGCNVG